MEDDVRLMQDVATVDLGHLAVLDPTPIDAARFRNQPEIFIKSHTSAAVQLLLRQLQTLPQQKDRLGVVVELPKPQTVLPREKPVPKPKPLTRWQKFAQEKGITKQKRSKMVWDETREEYRPRHGYNRVNDTKEDWILPHKEGKGDDYDPWEERAEEKRSAKEKQKMQEERNLREARETGYKAPLVKSVLDGAKQNKTELAENLAVVQRSTASMGKFDKKRQNEPGMKAPAGKRHKVKSVVGTGSELSGEKEKNMEALDKMLRGDASSKFNVDKAVNYQQVEDEQMGRTKKKKAGADGKKRRSSAGKPSNQKGRKQGALKKKSKS